LVTSVAYHGLPESIPEGDRRALVGRIDELGKGELRLLRERLDARLLGLREELADDGRVERLLERLAGDADA
jgi:hypothetical protein